MTDLPPPLPESYWVVPGKFSAGEYPGSIDPHQTNRRLLDLRTAGIVTFIDLTEPSELPSYLNVLNDLALSLSVNFTYRRFPVHDGGLPDRLAMRAVLDYIDGGLAAGQHIYLHCWGGVGRTGTTVGCYLVRHGFTGQQALDQLALWWQNVPKSIYHPRSPETDEQMRFVLEWNESPIAARQHPKRGDQRRA